MTIELDDAAAEVLRTLAKTEQRTETEILRDALTAYTSQQKRQLPLGIGKYHSSRADGSEQAEQILERAARDGSWP